MANNINFTKDDTFDDFVTEKVNVIKNGLLGDYNEDGTYIINEKVVLELLKLDKTKHSTFNNSIFCTSYMPNYGEITFELELKKQGNNGIAVIYVLEKVDKINGYIQNTIKTQIAIYKDVLTPDFIDRAFKGYNIKRINETEDDDDDQKIINPADFKATLNTYIGARRHFMSLLDNQTADDYNEMYKKYFNQRMDILKQDNSEYANLILKKYGLEYDKIKDYFLKNEGEIDYKALNELLDKCFEDVNGLDPKYREKEEELKKRMIPYLHQLMLQAQAINEKGKQKIVQKAKTIEKNQLAEVAKDKEKAEKSKSAKAAEKAKEKSKSKSSSLPSYDFELPEKGMHPINDDNRFKQSFESKDNEINKPKEQVESSVGIKNLTKPPQKRVESSVGIKNLTKKPKEQVKSSIKFGELTKNSQVKEESYDYENT